MDSKVPPMETLEIEDQDVRLERLQNIFEKMNGSAGYKPPAVSPLNLNLGGEGGLPDGEATSQLLARVQNFLPHLASSNAALAAADLAALDIENVREGEGYIEMNLGLGVFEDRKGRACASSSSSSDSDSNSASDSDGDSDSDSSDADSDSDSEIITTNPTERFSRPVKPLPRRTGTGMGMGTGGAPGPGPMIVEIDGDCGHQGGEGFRGD